MPDDDAAEAEVLLRVIASHPLIQHNLFLCPWNAVCKIPGIIDVRMPESGFAEEGTGARTLCFFHPECSSHASSAGETHAASAESKNAMNASSIPIFRAIFSDPGESSPQQEGMPMPALDLALRLLREATD